MSVRPHPSKSKKEPGKWWQIIFYPNGRAGKQQTIVFNGTELEAKQIELEMRRQSRAEPLQNFPRISQAVPDFIATYKLDHQPSGVERTIRSIKILMPFFGKIKFPGITRTLIERYKEKRLQDGVKPTTINKELATLSSMCKWAEEHGHCQPIKIKRFPPKMTKAPMPDVPPRYEVLAFLNSMDWPKCGMFCCMYYGGLRVSEATHLQADKVYLHRGLMTVRGKGNKERVVPIVTDLMPILEKRLQEIKKGYIWGRDDGSPRGDMRSTIKWACKRAGITRNFHPHLLRHAFGVHATESGIGLKSLQQVMGHTTSQVTELYSHLAAEALKKEMNKF